MPQVFVPMPFREEFDDVYAVVDNTCADGVFSGDLSCQRADELMKPGGKITEEIIESIRAADVLIADLTDANPNVMYELGYAAWAG